jgi:hypothetical protein
VAICHKRDTDARRKPKAAYLAGPLALLVTGSAVAAGVLVSDPDPSVATSARNASTSQVSASVLESRRESVSRADSRLDAAKLQRALDAHQARQARAEARAATLRAVRNADTRRWTTAPLYLWTAPGKGAKKVGLIDELEHVLVTGRRTSERVELVINRKPRWVTRGYLADNKPQPPPPPAPARPAASSGSSGRSAAPAPAPAPAPAGCTNGSSVPSGVSPNVAQVHEAVCAAFPELTTYGTFRSDGEHAQGLAIDIMVSGSRGQQVADFVRSNYSSLGVNYIIYAQQIWSVDRGGEGWRGMEDRGSTTANHYDHVHVTTY